MDNDKSDIQEFTLEVDSELRFEIETKNKKVTVEVSKGIYCLWLRFFFYRID